MIPYDIYVAQQYCTEVLGLVPKDTYIGLAVAFFLIVGLYMWLIYSFLQISRMTRFIRDQDMEADYDAFVRQRNG